MPCPGPFGSARGDRTVTDSREGRLSPQKLVAFQGLVLGSLYHLEYIFLGLSIVESKEDVPAHLSVPESPVP